MGNLRVRGAFLQEGRLFLFSRNGGCIFCFWHGVCRDFLCGGGRHGAHIFRLCCLVAGQSETE